MVTSYNVVSEDGYIADKNWDESFIPDSTWPQFIKLINESDAVVLGRKSYDSMYREYSQQIIDEFEQTRTKKIILSQDPSFEPKAGYRKASSLEETLAQGSKILMSGGPSLNAAFLDAGLIDRFVRLIIPVNLGEGIRPFPKDPQLTVVSSQRLKDGTILEEYALN